MKKRPVIFNKRVARYKFKQNNRDSSVIVPLLSATSTFGRVFFERVSERTEYFDAFPFEIYYT